jgi:hypothetical protein
MDQLRICKISDDLFSGFTVVVDISYHDNIDKIAKYAKDVLVYYMEKEKLEILVVKANEKQFHIHDIPMSDIISNVDEIIWVCGHC